MLIELRSHRWVTFGVLAIGVSAFALLQSLVIPVLSRIQTELDTDQSTVTWLLTAYLVSASVFSPLLGRCGDVFGKKTILVGSLLTLALGSLGAAVAPSIGWLIAARVLQGAGGGVLPLSFGIVRDVFPDDVTGALSVLASLTAVGFGGGIILAGPLVEALGYRWLFWLPMCATLVAALCAIAFVPESPRVERVRLPAASAVLMATWLIALLVAVSMGNRWGWGSPGVVGLIATALAAGVGWIVAEVHVAVPLIDMHMMRARGVWSANLVAACVGFGMFASFGFLPQFLQTPSSAGYGFGASVTESGFLLVPSAIASFLAGMFTARMTRQLGARHVILAGAAVAMSAFVSISLWHDAKWQLYAATAIQGVGSGLVFSSLAGVVIAAVPRAQTGVASGMNANIRTIGGALGSAVMASVVTARAGSAGYPAEAGYTVGFAVLAVAMLLAVLAATQIPDLRDTASAGRMADAENAQLGPTIMVTPDLHDQAEDPHRGDVSTGRADATAHGGRDAESQR